MSVIPSKIIPTLGSGSGGGGSGGSGASIDDIKAAVKSVLGECGSVWQMPDFSRAIALETCVNSVCGAVYKINVPGYIFESTGMNGPLDRGNPYIEHYLAAHPGYFMQGSQYNNADAAQYHLKDWFERILLLRGVTGNNNYYTARNGVRYIVPGLQTFYKCDWYSSGGNGIPSLFFVPARSLNTNIKPEDYVTPIYNPKYCISLNEYGGANTRHAGYPGSKWINAIFKGDWTENFEISGDVWRLKDFGYIMNNGHHLITTEHGAGGLASNTWWLTNGLHTKKDRVYLDSSNSYVIRYVTAEEAASLKAGAGYGATLVGSNSRITRDGTIVVKGGSDTDQFNPVEQPEAGLTWADMCADRWCMMHIYLGDKNLLNNGKNASQHTIIVDGHEVTVPAETGTILEHVNDPTVTYNPVGPAFTASDVKLVNAAQANITISQELYAISKERYLDDPPSGFGEGDFEANAIPGEDGETSTTKTMFKLNQVQWFRCWSYPTSPSNVPGVSMTDCMINTPADCDNVWNPVDEEEEE